MTKVPAHPFDQLHGSNAASGPLPDEAAGDPLAHSPIAHRVGDGAGVETLDYVYAKAGAMLDLAAGFGPASEIAISGPAIDS